MRLDLTKPRKGVEAAPWRGFVYGPPKVGKSTFAADTPSPIFFDTNRGTSEIDDIVRVPYPEDGSAYTWHDVLDVVDWLTTQEHNYRTIVFEDLGDLEAICWQHVCASHSKGKMKYASIEDFDWGKGYVIAIREWRILLAALERMQRAKPINVLFLSHSVVSSFKNPEGPDFDRYEPKAHKKLVGLLGQWCSFIGFARHEELVDVDEAKRRRGVSTGQRLIHTVRTAAYDAGNRYWLPERLSLDWADFEAAMAGDPDEGAIMRELDVLRAGARPDVAERIVALIDKAKGDTKKLAKLVDWARGHVVTEGSEGQ